MTPPSHMNFVGDGDFIEVGKHLVDILKRTVDLKPSDHVLDVGSGIGRVAIPMTAYLDNRGKYEGLEIVQSGISWCESRITPRFPNFKFKHADIFNSFYNPKGRFKAENYVFPYPDNHFDVVFLTSVFTHMLPQEVEHYLNEIHRVLKPNGRCFASFFVLNEKSREMISAGKSVFSFKFGDDVWRINDELQKEAAVAFDEKYIRTMFSKSKLKLRDPILYGRWNGRDDAFDFQDFVISIK